jgi:AcrR family transcriptional regulator
MRTRKYVNKRLLGGSMARDSEATRGRLLAAARTHFAEQGFERTSLRSVAAAAGVNVALINRYFGSKEELFAQAVDIELRLPDLTAEPRETVGRKLIEIFFARWDGTEGDDLLRVLIRTAATHASGAARVREVLQGQIMPLVAAVCPPAEVRQRAVLVATQILGLAFCRYVLELGEDDLPADLARPVLGETLRRYLFDPLPAQK